MNDRRITITVGRSRREMHWQRRELAISEFFTQLATPQRGVEDMRAYCALPKPQQDELKDVGGFVGGAIAGPRRKAAAVLARDLVTLDLDNIPAWATEDVTNAVRGLEAAFCVYSTRKHRPDAPRLRIIIPTDRTMTPDEYEPVARRIAERLGMVYCDPTTFEAQRLMFWPSCCSDGEYVYRADQGPELLAVDGVLATYADWRNVAEWPRHLSEGVNARRSAAKQGAPDGKPGAVGAFCRVYDILTAIDTHLPGLYTVASVDPTGIPDRLTYTGGSTAGGAVLYDNARFLYSHHATDPCSGRLVNAFDLVRVHKFGDKDDAVELSGTPVNRLPSYQAMQEYAYHDPRVQSLLARERRDQAARDFDGLEPLEPVNAPSQGVTVASSAGRDAGKQPQQQGTGNASEAVQSPQNDATAAPDHVGTTAPSTPAGDWMDRLERTNKGQVKNTIDNARIILEHDPRLCGRFALNEFSGRGEVRAAVPWNRETRRRMWSDTDSSGLYWYLEKVYGINGRFCIDSALDIHAAQHAFNDVVEYLDGLTWDGVERLDTLLVDYLGAQDSAYTRAVTRKAFTACVARAMDPGCKYDCMLILSGPQGIGKSTILDKMSRGWYNDNLRTFEGKEASEMLQGAWLIEVSELDAFRRTDVSRIKQFLSLRADRFRAAYGRNVKELPRRCVFFGTTNTAEFLQDSTGNRRFWPVDVGVTAGTKSVFSAHDFGPDVIGQIWAEAKTRWILGEALHLDGGLLEEARGHQEEHREISALEGIVTEFLGRKVPSDWDKYDLQARRTYWGGGVKDAGELVERRKVCAYEVLTERLMVAEKEVTRQRVMEINGILRTLEGWKQARKYFGPYGLQRGFVRA